MEFKPPNFRICISFVATRCEVILTLSALTRLLKKCQELLCVLEMCYVYKKSVVRYLFGFRKCFVRELVSQEGG